ncbi:uncharacterized protein [Epargyreus clarus]|uniref:uncharacterized protein n=1 Tax=Epargyreus clarus TaxID=520877 RepID=UPI003C2C5975
MKLIKTAVKNTGCTKYKKIGLVAKLKKCTRKSNYEGSFLKIMTNLLNTYVKSQYKFTIDMTEVLLEKIIGKNTDLRHDILDVNNLLRYLREAIHLHQGHENPDKITLKPKHCLTISLPGCYCRSGFVESFGQCVEPSDCVDDSTRTYLSRVVVL